MLILSYVQQSQVTDAESRRSAENLAASLADAGATAISAGRADQLPQLVSVVAALPDVLSGVVIGPSGEILAHSSGWAEGHSAGVPPAGPLSGQPRAVVESGEGSVRAIYPLSIAGQRYGWAVVSFSTEMSYARVRSNLLQLGIFVFFGLLVFCLLNLISSSYIFGPLRALASAAKQRDPLPPAEISSRDEIGFLVASFRDMQTALHQQIADGERRYDSERRRAEETIALLRSADDNFSVAAHDLRTPATTIKGYSQLMRRWLARGESGRFEEALKALESQSDYLARLVETLLDVSRIESGCLQLTLSHFNMVDLVGEVVERLRLTTNRHSVRLDVSGEVWGTWDRNRIEQVFSNLIGNAIKYSPAGGELSVTVKQGDGEVRVHVRDRGIGIAQQDMEKLFVRFQRLSNVEKLGLQGSGLGLYIVKGILAAHGGRVWVESEIGKGSTFSFSLPLEDAATGM